MKKYFVIHSEDGEKLVHYEGPFGDYALCGDALEVDRNGILNEPEITKKRVTCEKCLLVVKHVKGR